MRQRLSGDGNTEARQLKSYEALRNTQAFADSNLTLAQQSYQQAVTDALRLQRYLSIIAQPVSTDRPSSPRTAILLLQALALGFVLMFVLRAAMALLRDCAMVDATIERRGARDATEPDAATRLRDVIQRILEATDPAQAMAALGPALAQAADGWRDARRLLVSPWVRQARYAPAIAALETMVAAYPARVDERRLLASLLGRTEQWDRAIAQADAAAGIAPEDASLHAARSCAFRPVGSRTPPGSRARRTPWRWPRPPTRTGGCWPTRATATRPRRPASRRHWTRRTCRTRAWPRWPCAPCSTTTG